MDLHVLISDQKVMQVLLALLLPPLRDNLSLSLSVLNEIYDTSNLLGHLGFRSLFELMLGTPGRTSCVTCTNRIQFEVFTPFVPQYSPL